MTLILLPPEAKLLIENFLTSSVNSQMPNFKKNHLHIDEVLQVIELALNFGRQPIPSIFKADDFSAIKEETVNGQLDACNPFLKNINFFADRADQTKFNSTIDSMRYGKLNNVIPVINPISAIIRLINTEIFSLIVKELQIPKKFWHILNFELKHSLKSKLLVMKMENIIMIMKIF